MAKSDKPDDSGNEGGLRSEVDGITAINPADIPAPDSSGNPAKRGPGRPRKDAGNPASVIKPAPAHKEAKGSPLSVNSVQFSLTGIHALLAVALSAPELVLSDTEAETIAKNVVAVAKHYDLQQSAKATDWGNLILSLGVVYGGRMVSIYARNKAARPPKKPPAGFSQVQQPPAPAAPSHIRVDHPNAAGPPSGATPLTRKATVEDQAMLNEIEPAMFAS